MNLSFSSNNYNSVNESLCSTNNYNTVNNSNMSFNMNLSNCNNFENFKNIDFLKELIICYSFLTESYYFVILNKIFIIDNTIHEFSNSDKDFVLKEKIYKNFPISYFIIEDPYAYIFMDNKIHIHFCTDLKKPLEIINLEYTFSLANNKITYKKLNQFFNENKANLFNDLIEFNDVFHMNRLRTSRGGESILNSCQQLLLIYDTKNFRLDWIYSKNIETQFSVLKKINFIFSCKYMGYYSRLLNSNIKDENNYNNYLNNNLDNSSFDNFKSLSNNSLISMKNKNENNIKNNKNTINLDLFKSYYFPSNNFINILNEKFLLKNSLILLYSLISINDYSKAKLLLEEVKIDKIFIMVLLKNFINSKKLLFILDKIVFNLSVVDNIHEIILKSYSENNNFGNLFEIQNQNQILIFKERFLGIENIDIQLNDLIEATLIKTEKDLSIYLKGFFNTLIFYRNDLKIYLNKFRKNNIDGELIIKKFISENFKENKEDNIKSKRKSEDENLNNYIFDFENLKVEYEEKIPSESSKENKNNNPENNQEDYKNNSSEVMPKDLDTINEINSNQKLKSEIELRYLIIENIIFVCNYFSFKYTNNQKYSDNLKLMIKISHNILEKDFINLLQSSDLDEEILLFYYYKGNYSKCLNKIVSIYDSLEKIDFEKNNLIDEISLQKFDKLKNLEYPNKDLNSNENIELPLTVINISKPKLKQDFINQKIRKKEKNEQFLDLKNLQKTISFEKLGYNMNVENNVKFINKEALLDNTEDLENDNISNNNFSDNEKNNSFKKQENFHENSIEENKNSEIFTLKIDDTILKNNNITKENNNLKNIDKIKNQWFIRYINLINLISTKIKRMELMEYIKWALSKNSFKTVDILLENKIISTGKIENEFLDILKPFGIDAVIYYLKFILGNNKIEDASHQNEIINLYTLKLKLLYESLQKEDYSNFNESFFICKKKILSKFYL